jgi:hypothetical protein
MSDPESFEKKSAELLEYSLKKVPFYRDTWAKYDPGASCGSGGAVCRHAGAYQGGYAYLVFRAA